MFCILSWFSKNATSLVLLKEKWFNNECVLEEKNIYIYTYYISQFGLCTCICTEIRKYTKNFYGFLPDWGIRDNFNFLLYIFKSEKRKEKNLKENKLKELFKFHNIQQE